MGQVPVFQTEEDRVAEREVLGLLARAYGMTFVQLEEFDRVDGLLARDGHTRAVVEVKNRTGFEAGRLRSRPVWVSVRKVEALEAVSKALSQPYHPVEGRFVSVYDDGIFWVSYGTAKKCPVEIVGREPRAGAVNDQECCYLVPLSYFGKVEVRDGAEDGEGG